MALKNKELQANYRKRMYESGYKQMQVWVPRDSEGKSVKLERKLFIKRIESLTVGWSKSKLNRLFREVLNYISEKINKEEI